ncbi:hypothetical protein PDIG_69210 [Penicillium digitatum PHI26]|uniref:Uncharacterized protein n=2 Tax=Penicillium digitatum TaxID=36651 RepID=K9G4G5_PEND2|nr:hypothetical protein PDIP_78500 [Penicillium digitatum Pd1]EKV06589.1 hypothetical protein PDIP_78500 [Penicillium digitatum Pd1]EKV08156.1 hypothetical protein PDIG_69210 [Penicillium digitatum PHI26]
MASKGPWPACVEDYDEEHHAILPDTRLSANIAANTAAKLSTRLERFQEPLIDGASDSGYSSRTAATVNSTQSGPSGGKGPTTPLKLDTPRRNDLARKSSTRERKDKERSRPSREEKMVGAYPGAAHHAHVPRSSSKSRQRESSHAGPYHDNYYDYPTQYHQSNPGDHRQSEYSYYQSRPPVPEYSSSSHHAHYPAVVENIHASHSGRPSRSNSYHTYHPNGRPMSFHGVPHGMGSGMASPMYPQHGYDHHGPPPASSAYMHQYSSSSYGQTPSYYAPSASDYPPSEYPRERSRSREPSRHRSSSVYTAPIPPVDSASYPWFDEEPPMEHYSSRDVRERPPTRHQEQDEDYYRMPPPGAKPKPRPQIHQAKRPERPEPPRKMHTSAGIPSQRRPSRGMDRDLDRMDMPELGAALPVIQDRSRRRISREAPLPERTHSLRDRRRSTSYQDDRRTAQVAVASSRRRKPIDFSDDEQSSSGGDLEDLEREAENYQAARSGRAASAALPPSADALLPAKASHRNGSESGSQNSRSSRDSATPSRKEEDKNMTLTLNGFQIGFTSEAVTGKSINILTEETGGVRLNIGGPRVPKQHVNSTSSNYAGGSSRRELEDVVRRPRDDRRSERSRR